ncbi:unnamed protein product [Rotaria sordida]|uniref:Serine protease n=1 Tax=Rotaria sordida TaxID=392033 RepID=A0A814FDB3_9BILA|nr:unnamed protein product [Rotaria sordida]
MLENTLSAVVTVAVYNTSTTKKSMGFSRGNGDDAYSKILDLSDVQGSGSGFIINYNNIPYIITNAHVVEYADGNINSIAAFSINRKKSILSVSSIILSDLPEI